MKAWGFPGLGSLSQSKARYIFNELLSTALLSFRGEFDVYHPTLYRHAHVARWKKMVITHHDCALRAISGAVQPSGNDKALESATVSDGRCDHLPVRIDPARFA